MIIGDKTAALAKYFIEDEILPELTIQPIREELKHKHSLGDDEYPEGLVQPGMVIFAHKGNLIMHWEAPVTEANGYGAANRPEMDALWDAVSHRTVALDHGSTVMPIHGSKLKMTLPLETFPDAV